MKSNVNWENFNDFRAFVARPVMNNKGFSYKQIYVWENVDDRFFIAVLMKWKMCCLEIVRRDYGI